MAKYLDESGLGTLWGQIKEKFYSTNDLGLEYKSDTKKLCLLGKSVNGEKSVIQEIDATPFIKDGMLQDVNIIDVVAQEGDTGKFGYQPEEGEFIVLEGVTEAGKYIIFQWNTDGESKIDLIKASEIGAVYTPGEAITISDNKIDVEVDPAEGNAISKSEKGIAVSKVGTSITKTTSMIPVAGGPLADLMKDTYPDGIPADTDLQSLLVSLFAKELYPDAEVTPGKLSSAFAQPNVAVPSAGQTVEVGTAITIPQFVGYVAGNTPTPRKYSGFTYGWSAADDDTKDGDDNPSDVRVEDITVKSGDYTVTRTYNGFGKETTPVTSKNATATEAIIAEDATCVVAEGANTVKFDISGPGYTGRVPLSSAYYIVSNFGNTQSDKLVAEQSEQSFDVNATSGTRTYTVTGNYKYFMGYSAKAGASEFTSEDVRALAIKTGNVTPNGTTTIVGASEVLTTDGTNIVIAIPSAYKVKSIQGGLGNDMLDTCKNTGTVQVQTGTIQTEYTIYIVASSAALEFKNVTIGK